MHPMGFQVLIGFKDSVALFYVMRQSIRKSHELLVSGASHLSYSHAGALFAYVVGSVVRYHDTITFECMGELNFGRAAIHRVRGFTIRVS
jgi:hypothetical protein